MDAVDRLLRIPLFDGLGPADLHQLVPHLRERAFARGEPVWLEGDRAESLFFLVEGQLKSFRVSRDGTEVVLMFNRAVDIAGEVGLFHPSGRRQVSVTALEPSRCYTVPKSDLVTFMTGHPAVLERMLGRLATTAVRAAYSFSGVAFDDIRRRVAGALLALADEFGEHTADGVRIRLQLSQSTLAALVAASRENVNRALSTYIASGAVSQHDGHFHVHDVAALRAATRGSEISAEL